MKKVCVIALIYSIFLSGCINWGSKGNDSESKDEAVSISQDDIAMEKSSHLKFKGVR